MADVHDSAPYEMTIEAVGTDNKSGVDRNTRTIVKYEDYSEDQDQLNIRRPSSPAGGESARPQTTQHIDEPDLDASDRALKSTTEKIKKPE